MHTDRILTVGWLWHLQRFSAKDIYLCRTKPCIPPQCEATGWHLKGVWTSTCARLPWPTDEFCGILTWGRLQYGLSKSWSGCPVPSDTLQRNNNTITTVPYQSSVTLIDDSDFTCLSKDRKGHSLLVFALRQQRYGYVTTDLLQLVGTLNRLADRTENIPHPPPVLQLGAKLSGRKTSAPKHQSLRQNQADKDKNQPLFPPQCGPHSGTPDREQRRFLFIDKGRINQSLWWRTLAGRAGFEWAALTCQI